MTEPNTRAFEEEKEEAEFLFRPDSNQNKPSYSVYDDSQSCIV